MRLNLSLKAARAAALDLPAGIRAGQKALSIVKRAGIRVA
jgi:hypothetical protein